MVTVTLNDETPTQQIIAKTAKTFTIRDSDGRAIVLKKPGVIAQFRIVEVAGESARNEIYMRMILPLIYVVELAGEPVTQPTTKMQLEGLMQRLDEHGVNAVMKGVQEHFGEIDPEADKAAVKKSQPLPPSESVSG